MIPWKYLLFSALVMAASDQAADSFKQAAVRVLESLAAKGYSSFGQFKLESFLHSMKSVDVKSTGWINRPQGSLGDETFSRSSAEWTLDATGKAHIQVNSVLWEKTEPEVRSVIGMHEYLGAEGLYDRNYEVSSALWALSTPEASHFNTEDKANLAKRISATAFGGGIVGIGGGGDEAGADTKVSTLRRDLGRLAEAGSDEEHRAIMANIQEDLSIQSEVKRNGNTDNGLLYDNVAPIDVAEASRTVTTCQQVLRLSDASQGKIYQELVKSNPVAAQKLNGVSGMLKWCRDYIKGHSP
jgi:hypothetical protein